MVRDDHAHQMAELADCPQVQAPSGGPQTDEDGGRLRSLLLPPRSSRQVRPNHEGGDRTHAEARGKLTKLNIHCVSLLLSTIYFIQSVTIQSADSVVLEIALQYNYKKLLLKESCQ